MLYVYRWSSDLYGRLAGLVAALLVSASPNILAHAGLASIDFSITATLAPAAYYAWRWLEDPSSRHSILAGVWGGVAVISKYSAIGFLPAIALAFVLVWWWRNRHRGPVWPLLKQRRALFQGALYSLSFCFVVWLCFQVHTSPLGEPGDRLREIVDREVPPGSVMHGPVSTAVRLGELAAPGLVTGLVRALHHAVRGHTRQFFWGELKGDGGWRLYFPVTLAVKTTLPFLLLLGVAAAAWFDRRHDPSHRGTSYALAAAAVVLLVGMASTLNIGVRHVLPIYPFLAILASSVCASGEGRFISRRPVILAASLLVVSHVVASATAHPDYLSYFNSLAQGREHLILADSNLDWGQDLGRLAEYLKENDIRHIHLAYFGSTRPKAVGIEDAQPMGPGDRPGGKIAISISLLQGLGPESLQGDYTWLLAHEPYAKVGSSIWLYDNRDNPK